VTGDLLRATARYIFFCSLAVAPWYYGGTTATSIQLINWLLGTSFLLWVIELFVNRRRPRLPKVLLVLVVVLLGIGGWMVFNASGIYDVDFGLFAPVRNLTTHAPGSVDYAISGAWMIRGALLLIAVLFVVDLAQDNDGLLRLWSAIVIVAGSFAMLALLQKATGAPMIFWGPSPERAGINTFFGSYYYHANAGAFLNLVLPLAAGLAVREFSISPRPAMRAMWVTIFVLVLGAVFANTSRMAQAIAIFVIIACALQLAPVLARRLSRGERRVALAGTAAILLVLFAVAQASHLEQPLQRWQHLSENITVDLRWGAARVALHAVPHTGLVGFGPGTFRVAFPHFNNVSADHAPGAWRFLHEDYLQTLLEWGWGGSALWALLFFGGVVIAVRALLSQRRIRRGAESDTRGRLRSPEAEWIPRRRLILPLVVVALIGVAIHALVDFPFQIYSIQLYVATYLGLCWGSALWR
jgi:hypothetical protein